MNIVVLGLGKLGLALSLVFAKAGFKVYGFDVNKERINEIKAFQYVECPESKVTEHLQKYGFNLDLSADYKIISDDSIVFVIVQTPSLADGHFDLSYVEKAVQDIHIMNENVLIVVSSNINIGSIDKLSKIHKRICYNPEFIAIGSIIHDFEDPNFVLIGAYNREDGEKVANIWRKIHKKPIYIVKPIESEIIKLSLNVSFTFGITFANMIGEICEKFKSDSSKVLDIIYLDRRKYKPGLGFAGPCFPRDVNCFKTICGENTIESGFRFASLMNQLNNYVVDKYTRKIKDFGKKKIGILGVAYKSNVPYIYESQPLKIAEQLLKEGHEVYICDPLAEENVKKLLKGNLYFCSSVEECVEKSDVIFIGTANYSEIKTKKIMINPWS